MTKRTITPKASYETTLLDAARTVARLQAKRRRYRKLVREIDAELKHARKMLRGIANKNDERRPDIAPSRLFNGATGHARPDVDGPVPPNDRWSTGESVIDDAFFDAFQFCAKCQSSHHQTNTQCDGLRPTLTVSTDAQRTIDTLAADLVALDPSTRGQK